MIDLNLLVFKITLNVNDLNTQLKGRLSEWIKKQID